MKSLSSFSCTSLVALSLLASNSMAAETPKTPDRLSLSKEASLELSQALATQNAPSSESIVGQSAWSFASLSCVDANFADGGEGQPFVMNECTFESAEGVEFKLDAAASKFLTLQLVSSEVQPLAGSSDELKMYSVKDFHCVSKKATACESQISASCSFENTSTFMKDR